MKKYKWYFNKYSQYEIIEETEDWLYCIKKTDFKVDYSKNFFDSYAVEKPFEMNSSIFNSCPFKDKIFKDYDVKFICLSGSSLYNCIDNISDYDIAVFVDKDPDLIHNDNECLFYKGRKLHWYYWDLNSLLLSNSYSSNLFKIELLYLSKDNVLADYCNYYNYILDYIDAICNSGLTYFIDFAKHYVISYKSNRLAHLYLLYCILYCGSKIDTKFMLMLKRLSYIEVPSLAIEKIDSFINILKKLNRSIVIENDFNCYR